MSRRIVLIRAINVGGASLPMADLRAIAADLGADDISTYIASGNLLCTPHGQPEAFDRALEQAIETQFGFFREVISRSVDEVAGALEAHPFDIIEPKFSYVSFLTAAPTPTAVETADEVPTGDDRWQVIGRELHLRYYDGAGRAQLNDGALMRRLGVAGTARNLNTVRTLIKRAR